MLNGGGSDLSPESLHERRNFQVPIEVRLMMPTEKTLRDTPVNMVGLVLGTNFCNGFGKANCRA